jgi:hypothetical protein
VIGLFDISAGLRDKFGRLSERVLINAGRIFFDGEEVHNALTDAIVRFYSDGNDDFEPLVFFMEKIETNPMQHSREQLFRWLSKHNFAIAPDGDIVAYKGLDADGRSSFSGEALVNGQLVKGRIPNKPHTIIEMPRSKVVHDPKVGCSVGLHVANWAFASDFADRNTTVQVKVNPRDVVSVPTDAHDQKMRVSRYRVLKRVTAEHKTALFVPDPERTARVVEAIKAKPKKEAKASNKAEAEAKAKAQKSSLPEFYEEFRKKHFVQLPVSELRWLAREWEIKGRSVKGADLPSLLADEAKARRSWNVKNFGY